MIAKVSPEFLQWLLKLRLFNTESVRQLKRGCIDILTGIFFIFGVYQEWYLLEMSDHFLELIRNEINQSYEGPIAPRQLFESPPLTSASLSPPLNCGGTWYYCFIEWILRDIVLYFGVLPGDVLGLVIFLWNLGHPPGCLLYPFCIQHLTVDIDLKILMFRNTILAKKASLGVLVIAWRRHVLWKGVNCRGRRWNVVGQV